MDDSLLNEAQREAVCHGEGPLLILAGAGSGKTRVLTHRIAYLIEDAGVHPESILALTFTNKAANEMKERVGNLVKTAPPSWVSTFHSACVRILRKDIHHLGYDNNFLIYDTKDKNALVKECINEINLDSTKYKPAVVSNHISRVKNEPLDSGETNYGDNPSYFYENVERIKEIYQEKLKKNNALDFDDLLLFTLKLFEDNQDVLEYYQNKFGHILVDEFQDTNQIQYELIKKLASPENNLFVVGDDDQSIYLFRGADVRNILYFERDYGSCKVIKLEKNYRSTTNILDAANKVACNNPNRKPKKLYTDNGEGEKIKYFCGENEYEEARFIAREISESLNNYSKIAILYRTNAQSRAIEEALLKENIRHKVVGTSFYDRKEVRDILAYLMVIENPGADLQLERVINEPKRGIGKSTIEKVKNHAEENGISFFDALLECDQIGLGNKAVKSIKEFTEMISNFRKMREYLTIKELLQEVAETSGYIQALQKQDTREAEDRIENIKELYSTAADFDVEYGGTLHEFLTNLSLVTDLDKLDEEEDQDNNDGVVLMTLHSAKGLEFPVVFLTGMEEEIFPHFRALENETEMEEERRICYVGITRAENLLYLTRANRRTLYGRNRPFLPSRFLNEIDENLIEDLSNESESIANENSFIKGFSYGSNSFNSFNDSSFKNNKSKSYNNSKTDSSSNLKSPKPPSFNTSNTPQTPKQQSGESYKEGEILKHKKWGEGEVLKAQEIGGDWVLTVKFENEGIKKLAAGLAPIEKIK
nr:UvrD-helicase domain-containing protein [Natranaerofaba carboxydovora]